jgi:hypothetical protein
VTVKNWRLSLRSRREKSKRMTRTDPSNPHSSPQLQPRRILDASERRLKAGYERMMSGLEGLDELDELSIRILVKEHLDSGAPKRSLNALGWVAAEHGIPDLCLSLYAGGAELAVLLEGAVLGRRLDTLAQLLALRPDARALQLAIEACGVVDATDAAQLLKAALGKPDWTQRLMSPIPVPQPS